MIFGVVGMKKRGLAVVVLISALSTTATACAQTQGDDGEQRQGRRGPPTFTALDLNGDSGVTLEEFQQHDVPHGDHSTIFNAIDSNGDGLISEAELTEHKPPRRGGNKPSR